MNTLPSPEDSDALVVARMRAWVDRAVIGLNLCPFARAVQVKDQVRYVVTPAEDEDALLAALCEQMHLLAQAAPAAHDTTLLIHPRVLGDFLAYNDFLEAADAAVEALGYAGVLQVASFHPRYQFDDTDEDDVTNATNRAPYPTLHLLREDSVDRAVDAFPEAESIYERNIETLERIGPLGWAQLQAQCEAEAHQALADNAKQR